VNSASNTAAAAAAARLPGSATLDHSAYWLLHISIFHTSPLLLLLVFNLKHNILPFYMFFSNLALHVSNSLSSEFPAFCTLFQLNLPKKKKKHTQIITSCCTQSL